MFDTHFAVRLRMVFLFMRFVGSSSAASPRTSARRFYFINDDYMASFAMVTCIIALLHWFNIIFHVSICAAITTCSLDLEEAQPALVVLLLLLMFFFLCLLFFGTCTYRYVSRLYSAAYVLMGPIFYNVVYWGFTTVDNVCGNW